jgi:cAMP and cAMP-inhibited cGMP 3',5'-cyclic phosphodiesterase 10
MISMDILIRKVMNFAQKLVDADRASLFLVDSKTNELYARLFDTGIEAEPGGNHTFDAPSREIRCRKFENTLWCFP